MQVFHLLFFLQIYLFFLFPGKRKRGLAEEAGIDPTELCAEDDLIIGVVAGFGLDVGHGLRGELPDHRAI